MMILFLMSLDDRNNGKDKIITNSVTHHYAGLIDVNTGLTQIKYPIQVTNPDLVTHEIRRTL